MGTSVAYAEKCRLGTEVPRQVDISGSTIIVFIETQCFGVYVNGRIARRNVTIDGWYGPYPLHGYASTGKEGHETPLSVPSQGPQRVIRASRDHASQEIKVLHRGRWIPAPMPYALFFDERGRALHAGRTLRENQSSGCVRLPMEAARVLFDEFRHSTFQIIIVWSREDLRRDWEGRSFATPTDFSPESAVESWKPDSESEPDPDLFWHEEP